MSSAAEATNIVGYFNAYKFPLHIHISECNRMFRLEPNQYVLTEDGRKINDPILGRYRQLSVEQSDDPVPVLFFASQAKPAGNKSAPVVASTTSFTVDAKGRRVPDLSAVAPVVKPPASDVPSIRAMTVEEARKLRLIKPVRTVPEDYGVTDNDGASPTNIPELKVAVDAPNSRAAAAVPVALEPEPEVPAQAEFGSDDAAQIIQQAGVDTTPAEPVLEAQPVRQPVVIPAPKVAPAMDADKASRANFICLEDGRKFTYRSQLLQYVTRKYPNRVEELMAPYPKQP